MAALRQVTKIRFPVKLQARKLPAGLVLVLGLTMALNICGIWWGVFEGYPHSWAVDEVRPLMVINGISAKFSGGWYAKYPPLHFYLLSLLYSPALLLHAIGSIDLWHSDGSFILSIASRLLSVGMSAGILVCLYACADELGLAKRAGILAALIGGLTVQMVYYSKTANLDVPYTFWFTVSLLFLIRSINGQRLSDHLLFAVTAILAVCTKDQAYGLYVLTVPFLWLSVRRVTRIDSPSAKGLRFLLDPRIVVPSAVAILLFALIHNLALNAEGFLEHVRFITGPGSDPYRAYEANVFGQARMLVQATKHLAFSFGPPMFLVCIFGVVDAARRADRNRLLLSVLLPAVSYYVSFIAVIGYNLVRFLLPVCVVLALFGGKWLADRLRPGLRFRRLRYLLFGTLVAYSVAYVFSVDSMMLADSRYDVQRWMEANIPRSAVVVGLGHWAYHPALRAWKASSFLVRDDISIGRLRQISPDFVVTTSAYGPNSRVWLFTAVRRYAPESAGHEVFSQLYGGELEYEQIYEWQGQPRLNLLPLESVSTNLDKINPRIRVFAKRGSSTISHQPE